MKFCASALMVIAAATGALAQSIGPETSPSEQFGILTIHRFPSSQPPNLDSGTCANGQYCHQRTFTNLVIEWPTSCPHCRYQSHHDTRFHEWRLVRSIWVCWVYLQSRRVNQFLEPRGRDGGLYY